MWSLHLVLSLRHRWVSDLLRVKHSTAMTIGGPLFVLRWWGGLCPCLEKEEDKNARLAVQHLHNCTIAWKRSAKNGTASTGSRLLSFFQSSTAAASSSSSSRPITSSDADGVVVSKLLVRDDANGEPELFVDPQSHAADPIQTPLDGSSPSFSNVEAAPATVGYKLHVLLRRVDRVCLEGDNVRLLARKVDRDQPPKELLRFSLDGTAADTQMRNLTVHHLSVLVEWERQRRRTAGYHESEDDDDDENQPNFLAARAHKAAHFAKRELEMQQTKREREKRKAKFVQESGGLKYTALAMASRGESA